MNEQGQPTEQTGKTGTRQDWQRAYKQRQYRLDPPRPRAKKTTPGIQTDPNAKTLKQRKRRLAKTYLRKK